MERGAENKPDGMGSENFQGFRMVGLKHCKGMGDKMARRPLRDLNNRTGNSVPYPSALLKRGSAEVAPCDVKNAKSINNHRPITRGFAASQAQKYHECLQNDNSRCEDQRRNQPVQAKTFVNPSDEEPVAFPNDEPLPMVEEIEEMIDCELKEVEMEDLEAEILREIDISDAHNPLAVVNYVDEIYSFYRETEVLSCVPPNYMAAQSDINERMRAILIDWLIEVHYKFDLVEETLFLTVNIIDRFLARHSVLRKKLQLVGVTAMLLACKYEEVMVPVVEDLILISDRAYTRDEVLQMESLIVNTLQFNMSVPTPYMFLRRFLKASQSDKQLELLTSYITELCLVEYEMLKFRPSMLAAAAVYTAQCTLKGFKHWTRTSELCSKYSDAQLLECSKMMVEIHERSGKGKLIGAYKKYSTFRFGFAARSEPALFLLDMKI